MKIFSNRMPRQMLAMAGTHILANVTIGVVGLVFIAAIFTNPLYSKIFTIFTILIYAMVIYSKAWQVAERDNKLKDREESSVVKGALLPLIAILLSIVLLGGYLFAWNCLAIDGALASATAYIYNIVYILSTFAFNAFLGLSNGSINICAHILMYIVPIVASLLGYIAGKHGFLLAEKLMPMIYEKKK